MTDKAAARLKSDGWKMVETTGFIQLIGPLWQRPVGDTFEYGLLTEDKHHNRRGLVQGGVLMTFADRTCGMIARHVTGKTTMATAQLDVHFMEAGKIGELLVSRPRVVMQIDPAHHLDPRAGTFRLLSCNVVQQVCAALQRNVRIQICPLIGPASFEQRLTHIRARLIPCSRQKDIHVACTRRRRRADGGNLDRRHSKRAQPESGVGHRGHAGAHQQNIELVVAYPTNLGHPIAVRQLYEAIGPGNAVLLKRLSALEEAI